MSLVVLLNFFRSLAPRTRAGTSSYLQSQGHAHFQPSPPPRGCRKPFQQQGGNFLQSLLQPQEYISGIAGGWTGS